MIRFQVSSNDYAFWGFQFSLTNEEVEHVVKPNGILNPDIENTIVNICKTRMTEFYKKHNLLAAKDRVPHLDIHICNRTHIVRLEEGIPIVDIIYLCDTPHN